MSPADRFAALPRLLAADQDLLRRGRWLTVECRVDVGSEQFFLSIRDGALVAFERGPKLMRSTAFSFRATDEAWTHYWKPMPEPGWHDLFALTKRGAASMEGDLRPLLQNLQYFKDLLALPREIAMSSDKVAAFAGTLAAMYDRYLVPLNFRPYAEVVAERVKALRPRRVLETAAGTGVVTEALARVLPTDVTITATDLNQAMIEVGKARPGMQRVNWQQADAAKLPFADGAFDLIICQFGVMFFPDKRASFQECFRVLSPGGTYLFVLWDDYRNMPDSPLWIATRKVGDVLGRDPHTLLNPGYFDEPTIRADLAAAGFKDANVERIARTAKAASAREAAVITVQGSLLRTALEATSPSLLDGVTKAVEEIMIARFGDGPVEGEMKALLVTTTKAQ